MKREKTQEELQEDLDSIKAFAKYEDNLVKQNPIHEAFADFAKGESKEDERRLRDHYAGLAMQGICVNAGRNKFDVDQADDIASYSYQIADAMLKARKEIK